MKHRVPRLLIGSIIFVIVLCVIVFTTQTIRMNRKSAETIGEIGELYMSGMSSQSAMHFGTIMDLRLSQVAGLVDAVPPDTITNQTSMRVTLTHHARSRGFDHLALCASDGTIDMFFGTDVALEGSDDFLESLRSGEQKITMGTDSLGEEIVLMGIPAVYPMEDGKECIGLVAGLPVSYISETLALNLEGSTDYYFIIRKDGSFIIRDDTVDDDDYFTRVQNKYTDVGGKSVEQYTKELRAAMAKGESYSTQFTLSGDDQRYLYATSLPNTEWYLMMFMPYGQLNEAIGDLGRNWTMTAIRNCMIIVLILLLIFSWYFHLLRQHMEKMEEAREAAEHANRAKSEFLSNMSHDIRTPMNGIVGMTALALSNPEDSGQVQNCLKKITQSSRHLLGLINDILDMAKIESGKMSLNMERTSLCEVAQGVADLIQTQSRQKDQEFEVCIRDISDEYVRCDSVRLNQVLMNLLGNAVKFTQEGGRIDLELYEEESPLGADHVRVHFRIRDNGIGMSEEFRRKVFETFAREDNARVQKTEGTGLGMAITKYIVDAMKGTIEVSSEQGKGTEFHVTLDLEKAPDKGADEPLSAAEEIGSGTFSGNHVIFAEDNDLNWEVADGLLSELGLQLTRAENGKVCVELFEQSPPGYYEAILMDIRMPVMNGYEASMAIRALDREDAKTVPIIAQSADAFSDDVRKCLDAGMNAHVAKPIDVPEIVRQLKKCMKKEGEK